MRVERSSKSASVLPRTELGSSSVGWSSTYQRLGWWGHVKNYLRAYFFIWKPDRLLLSKGVGPRDRGLSILCITPVSNRVLVTSLVLSICHVKELFGQ